MDPHDYLHALKKSWIVIVALVVVGFVVGFAAAHAQPDTYRATSSVFVSSSRGTASDQLLQGSSFSLAQVQSYAQLATTPAVLEPVIADLGLDVTPAQLATRVTASVPLNTVIINITATDASPKQARDISNAVSSSLRTVTTDLTPQTTTGSGVVSLAIVAPATTPTVPAGPNRHLIELLAALVGLVLGVIYAVTRFALDTRIRTAADVAKTTTAPVLGTVQRLAHGARYGLALRDQPESASAEDVRRIRTTLQFAVAGAPATSLTVVSARPGDGRTAFALDLALAAAERSARVLVIDADLRSGGIAALARTEGSAGLTTVLDGTQTLADAVTEIQRGVFVLPAGELSQAPSLALGSPAFASLLADAHEHFDLVIVDTPALQPFADALSVVGHTDGAVVVAAATSTNRAQLTATLAALEAVAAPVLGVVVTKSTPEAHAHAPARSHAGAPLVPAAPPAPATTRAAHAADVESPVVDSESAPLDADAAVASPAAPLRRSGQRPTSPRPAARGTKR
jgi:capsular exopolysaccharide synthesis family protein